MAESKRRGPWTWLLAVSAVALAVLAVVLIAGSGDGSGETSTPEAAAANVVQAGAPGEASRTLSADEAAAIEPPRHTDLDVAFVTGMIHHHAQGIEMTGLVPDRGAGSKLPLLAERTEISQEGEIELMERWLEERGEEAPSMMEHDHGHGAHLMPGMLTEAQMMRLEATRGAAFNTLFLRSMIRHHLGALTMVRQLREANGGLEPALDKLAREIEADQAIEIDRMRELLG